MPKRYAEEQRLELIELVRSGRPTVAAATELGVTLSTAYNWVRRGAGTAVTQRRRRRSTAKAQLPREARFVRVVPRAGFVATIAVRVGGAEIQVRRDFDSELLRAVVEALDGGGG